MTRGKHGSAAAAGVVAFGAGGRLRRQRSGGTLRRNLQHHSHPGAGPAGSGGQPARGFRSIRDYRKTAVPVPVEIPRIGVASSLDRLGRAPDGTVQVPTRWQVAGWYTAGPRPGDPGSAVILGHVDSKRGPAVFFRLRELRRGDEINVVRADGS